MNNDQIEILAKAFEGIGKKVTRWMPGPFFLEAYFLSSKGNTIVINSDGVTEVEGEYNQEFEVGDAGNEDRFVTNIEL